MPLNYSFVLIGMYFVRIKPGHNSRLYTLLYNISDTEEKNKTDSPSSVNAFTTVTNKAENSSSYFNHGGGKRGYT